MTKSEVGYPKAGEDPRRRQLLEASLLVFARYGFRKTSMEEVARAAQISRQGLYLHFNTKEALFRATIEHTLGSSLAAASGCLTDASLSLEDKLVRAFDEWLGRFIGLIGADASDLAEASNALVGSMLPDHELLFVEAVAKAIRGSRLTAAYKPAGLTARQLADTLCATARGLKHSCSARTEFVERITIAVRAMCLPIREKA